MDELKTQATALHTQVADAAERLKLEALEQEVAALQTRSQESDFWQDNLAAQRVMQQIAKLETTTKPWRELLDG
ncbi:MAG: hypothetical protein ACREGB_05410, partial [Candidatus Saccharimonadales bacterium]